MAPVFAAPKRLSLTGRPPPPISPAALCVPGVPGCGAGPTFPAVALPPTVRRHRPVDARRLSVQVTARGDTPGGRGQGRGGGRRLAGCSPVPLAAGRAADGGVLSPV